MIVPLWAIALCFGFTVGIFCAVVALTLGGATRGSLIAARDKALIEAESARQRYDEAVEEHEAELKKFGDLRQHTFVDGPMKGTVWLLPYRCREIVLWTAEATEGLAGTPLPLDKLARYDASTLDLECSLVELISKPARRETN